LVDICYQGGREKKGGKGKVKRNRWTGKYNEEFSDMGGAECTTRAILRERMLAGVIGLREFKKIEFNITQGGEYNPLMS